jgi:tRNA modification GTPase
VFGQAKDIAAGLARAIEQALADGRRGERIREGLTIALAGPPNAGKSTLFNWLAGREAAIVSPYPGTTRDVLEVHLDIAGYPVTVVDTAGLRDSDDPVELEGMRRAEARAAQADLTLWVEESDGGSAAPEAIGSTGGTLWRVRNKADLLDSGPQRTVAGSAAGLESHGEAFLVSAKTGAGLDGLMAALAGFVGSQLSAAEPALITRERHRLALGEASAALQRAGGLGAGQEELFAEDLRIAGRSLERLLGRVDVEDVLDVIFRDFCVGK